MRDNVARIFNVCGALAPLLFVVTFIVSGLFHAEYSHYRQYISELGERGSSTEVLMRYGVYYLPGVMFLAFGLLLVAKFRHSKVAIIAGLLVIVSGIARINGGNFPCDPGCMPVNPSFSQKMHNLSAGLATFPLACSAIFWGFASRKLLGSRGFGWYSFLSGVIAVVFLFFTVPAWATREGVGLFQRISLGLLYLWVFLMAIVVWRSNSSSANPSLHRIA